MPESPWRLDGNLARLNWRGAQACLDLQRPDQGIRFERWQGAPLDSISILGVVFPEVATTRLDCDAYTRGLDLIAIYAETPTRPFRVQAYWRCVTQPVESAMPAASVELQLSVQTPLLECTPVVHTRSLLEHVGELQSMRLPSAAAQAIDSPDPGPNDSRGEVFSAQVSNEPPTAQYAEMVYAADSQASRVVPINYGFGIEHDLFEPGLEKGVIRRVRVRGLLYAGAADDLFVEHAYHAFHATALPLTT